MPITLNIKCPTGPKFSIEVELSTTVADFKVQLQEKSEIPPEQQRLIYKGHVLKDAQTLESYALEEGHTVHLVRGSNPQPQAGGAGSTAAPLGAANPAAAAAANPLGNMFGAGGMGAMPGAAGGMPNIQQMQQQMMNNPQMMRDVMNTPAMQSLMQNPELIRNVIMNNPQLREVIERNPEIGHVLNDPQVFRQTMEVARNPELMREMMRTTDRAMSNMESHPEGFNMLRRMYQNVQEPLMDATSGSAQAAFGDGDSTGGDNPFASLFGQPVRKLAMHCFV
jgi:ubiquilin